MDLQLTGRRFLVTGASRGIGLAVAGAALDEGARVVAVSRTLTEELGALRGERLVHLAADLTHPDTATEAVARAAESFGGLDVLVNNVGAVAFSGSFLAIDDEAWRSTLDVNLLSAVRTTRAALPLLLESDDAAIVNVSSVNGRHPNQAVADYSAAKAALTNLGQALSEEFAPQGVRVNTVSPGPVRTPMWTADGAGGDVFAAQAGVDRETALTTVIPQAMQLSLGRMSTPEEVAALVMLLASPLSGSTTGSDWTVDAGFLKTA
jgi:NAD(P)-dependent dehydrogenase (short-subunit alcohol dehydrogenase family)